MTSAMSRVERVKLQYPPAITAAATLLRRRRARSDILAFADSIEIPGAPVDEYKDILSPIESRFVAHHRLILQKVDECAHKPHGRLMLLLPPGSSKSTYASVVYPPFYMGKHPGARVLLCSYSDDLASTMGRRALSILRQPEYFNIFGDTADKNLSSSSKFGSTNGSEYLAAGIMGGITGNRAGLLICDDVIRGREQADSPLVRDKVYDSYVDNAKTRLLPGGSVVIINTRWDEDDLSGRILPENWSGESGTIRCRDGFDWEVLCIQARCESASDPLGREIGEYLWPEWFDPKHWEQFESNPRTWESLFQQRPRPLDGVLFNQDDLLMNGQPVPVPTQCDVIIASIDTAFKGGDRNDGTAVVIAAYSRHTNIPVIILDWDVIQIDGDLIIDWLPSVMTRCEELAVQCRSRLGFQCVIEDKAAGTIALQHARRHNWPMRALPDAFVSLGKDSRCLSIAGYLPSNKVKISERAYNKTTLFKGSKKNHFMSQLLNYRLGIANQTDDAVDSFTGLCHVTLVTK